MTLLWGLAENGKQAGDGFELSIWTRSSLGDYPDCLNAHRRGGDEHLGNRKGVSKGQQLRLRLLLATICMLLMNSALPSEATSRQDQDQCPECIAWLMSYRDAVKQELDARRRFESLSSQMQAELTSRSSAFERRPEALSGQRLLRYLRAPNQEVAAAAFMALLYQLDAPGLANARGSLDANERPASVPAGETVPFEENAVYDALLHYVQRDSTERTHYLVVVQRLVDRPTLGLSSETAERAVALLRASGLDWNLRQGNPELATRYLWAVALHGIELETTHRYLMRVASANSFPESVRSLAQCLAALNLHAAGDKEAVRSDLATVESQQATPETQLCSLMRLWRTPDERVSDVLLRTIAARERPQGLRHAAGVALARRLLFGREEWQPEFNDVFEQLKSLPTDKALRTASRTVVEALRAEPKLDKESAHLLRTLQLLIAGSRGRAQVRVPDLTRQVDDVVAARILSNLLSDIIRDDISQWSLAAGEWLQSEPRSYLRSALRLAMLDTAADLRDNSPKLGTSELENAVKLLKAALDEQETRELALLGREEAARPDAWALQEVKTLGPDYSGEWQMLSGFRRPVNPVAAGRWAKKSFRSRDPLLLEILNLYSEPPMTGVLLADPPDPEVLRLRSEWRRDQDKLSLDRLAGDVTARRSSRFVEEAVGQLRARPWIPLLVVALVTVQLAYAIPSVWYWWRSPWRATEEACRRRLRRGNRPPPESQLLKLAGIAGSLNGLPYLFSDWLASRERCLSAWVRQHRDPLRASWQAKRNELATNAYFERIPAVVKRFGEPDQFLNQVGHEHVQELLQRGAARRHFAPFRVALVGPGGSGKTTMATAFALWALQASKDQRHYLGPLPVLVTDELNQRARADLTDAERDTLEVWFVGALTIGLQNALPGVPVDASLVRRLLDLGAIMPMIDHLSEVSDTTRGAVLRLLSDSELIARCVVTSRDDLLLQHRRTMRICLQPLDWRLAQDFFNFVVHDDLASRDRRLEGADLDPLYAFSKFQLAQRIVAQGSVSPLLVMLLARLAVAYLEDMRSSEASTVEKASLSDLMNELELVRNYVRALAWDARPSDPSAGQVAFLRGVLVDALALAWACVKGDLSPRSISWVEAISVLNRERPSSDGEERLNVLIDRVRLLWHPNSSQQDRVCFALDPVAELLACAFLLDRIESEEAVEEVDYRRILSAARSESPPPFIQHLNMSVRSIGYCADGSRTSRLKEALSSHLSPGNPH